MNEPVQLFVLTTLAGAAIPLGGFLATIERLRPDWLEEEFRHSVIAFGGGVLLSAVSLVLVPEGVARLPAAAAAGAFLLGGIVFLGFDAALARSRSSASQMLAMLADFIPESIAMGAAFATGGDAGFLLALLIGLQNLPEGFNAYRELASGGAMSRRMILICFLLLVPLGPAAGAVGYFYLAAYPAAVGFLMLVAAGGILYLTFQDVAPQARLEKEPPRPGAWRRVGLSLGIGGAIDARPDAVAPDDSAIVGIREIGAAARVPGRSLIAVGGNAAGVLD